MISDSTQEQDKQKINKEQEARKKQFFQWLHFIEDAEEYDEKIITNSISITSLFHSLTVHVVKKKSAMVNRI